MALVKVSSRLCNGVVQKCLFSGKLKTKYFCLSVQSGNELFAFKKAQIPFKSILRNYVVAVESVEDIRTRVLRVVTSFEKITPDNVKTESHFIQDLGLDSLDHVEIMMAVEDEFGFEIPDSDAERLLKPDDIIKYIAKKENIEVEEKKEKS